MKLNDIITKIGGGEMSTLGETEAGRAWLLKALNPADALTAVQGIPDMDSSPTVMVNYQTITRFTSPAAAATWDFRMTCLPNPLNFAHVYAFTAGATSYTTIDNPQIVGADYATKYANLKELAEYWRLAYLGYTVYLEAPATANQGTLNATQYDVTPLKFSHSTITDVAGDKTRISCRWPVHAFQTSDQPSFDNTQTMPQAFTTEAKNGCYMPIRLSNVMQKWYSAKDTIYMHNALVGNNTGGITIPKVTADGSWPYGTGEVQCAYGEALTTGLGGTQLPTEINRTWGQINMSGLSDTASVVVVVRMGLEMKVLPGSTFSTQLHSSPRYDARALESYYRISREMKDAYPAEYNDWGKLWPIIKNIAKAVTPALSMIPGVGAYLAPVAARVTDAVDDIFGGRDKLGNTPQENQKLAKEKQAAAEMGVGRRKLVIVRPNRPPPPPPKPKKKLNIVRRK